MGWIALLHTIFCMQKYRPVGQYKLCYKRKSRRLDLAISEELRGDLLNIYGVTPAHLHPWLPLTHVTLTPF